jgi:adenine-specific DNA-methyltransferase
MANNDSNSGYNAHIKNTARLNWRYKPNIEPEAKNLDFQNAEIVIPNLDKADSSLDNFIEKAAESTSIFEKPNRVIFGDNLLVMQALLAEGYEGKLDLIYLDPPFNTGEEFNFVTESSLPTGQTLEKEWTMIERLAYTDTWERGVDSFLDMLYPRLKLMRRLLADTGSIYVHIDWHMAHYVKVILDEIFGKENFINEIIWKRKGGSANPINRFGVVTDSIFLYSKTSDYTFNQIFVKENEETKKYIDQRFKIKDEKGRRFMIAPIERNAALGIRKNLIYEYKGYTPKYGWMMAKEKLEKMDKDGKLFWNEKNRPNRKVYLDEYKGQPVENIWTDIYVINPMASERLNFATQKPEALLARIIETSSNEGDLVGDFFAGSGTTASVAEQLKRKWIMADVSKVAIHVTRNRLINLNGGLDDEKKIKRNLREVTPFIVQNLGNYQRHLIYLHGFNIKKACGLIMKLYGAIQREDLIDLGLKIDSKDTLVFVSYPDRQVTAKLVIR